MSNEEQWGVGNAASAKAFGKALVGKEEVELITGEHPHSRSYNSHYARWPSGKTEAFDGHRIQVKIEIETYNYLKTSGLSGNEVREGGEGRIFFNEKQVYSFFFRQPGSALLQAHKLLEELKEHPSRLFEDDIEKKLKGRKVYYNNTPAIIKYVFLDQGAIVLEADNEEKLFPVLPYEKEEGDRERPTEIKDDILSSHIWWWRK